MISLAIEQINNKYVMMSCPFSGLSAQPSIDFDDTRKRDGAPRTRKYSRESRTWISGPSMESHNNFQLPIGTTFGVVQQTVSSFSNLSKLSHDVNFTSRKTSLGSKPRPISFCCKSLNKSEDNLDSASEPLFKTTRDPPDPNQPLSLKILTEAVWNFITIPADHLLNALDTLLLSGDSEWRKVRRKLSIVSDGITEWDDWHLDDLLTTLSQQLEIPQGEFMSSLGGEYLLECERYYGKALVSLGSDLDGFFINLAEVWEILKNNPTQQPKTNNDIPSILCNHKSNTLVLHFYTNRRALQYFMKGVIKAVGNQLFQKEFSVSQTVSTYQNGNTKSHRYYYKYVITQCKSPSMLPDSSEVQSLLSSSAIATKINVESFCNIFPWHFMCDTKMNCIQLGDGLLQVFGTKISIGNKSVKDLFAVIQPDGVALTHRNIISHLNTPFILGFKTDNKMRAGLQNMQIKGQMFECQESDSILFIGSPLVDGMDCLTSLGLYLSDIPIHDASRDVILVGEQSRAQDGLKRRMAQLKDSIIVANNAVDEEREKNVSLLHSIFPPDIAKRLWLGHSIEAENHAQVSMLFSDIVGFTSICSTATPLMVIDMLQDLYTKFDSYCGYLDIYKVETIGDAYCVAGNLHRRSRHHAQRVSWMALCMIVTCAHHRTHLGEPIRMRIGIHTGPILAGVVGTTMPRFCLFGSNVTLANSFESTSEPLKVNISPTTHRFLEETKGFTFTKRQREDLPKCFPQSIEGEPYFVEDFKHPDLDESCPLFEHVDRALDDLVPYSS